MSQYFTGDHSTAVHEKGDGHLSVRLDSHNWNSFPVEHRFGGLEILKDLRYGGILN